MKKYFNNIIVCLISAVLIFTVIGCKATTAAETTAAETTAAETTTVEPQKFLIGLNFPWGKYPFCLNVRAGAELAVKEWNEAGIEVELLVVDSGDIDLAQQISDMENLYAQGIQGLVFIPGDPGLLVDVLKDTYNANNIPIVPLDAVMSEEVIEELELASYVFNSHYLGGEMAAEWLATQGLPEGSKVTLLLNAPTFRNNQLKMAGFVDKITELGGFELLPESLVEFTLEDGKRVMEDVLAANPDVSVVYNLSQIIGRGVLSTLEENDRTDVLNISWDYDETSLELVMEGRIHVLVAQDPHLLGYEGTNQLLYYLTDDPRNVEVNMIDPYFITPENAADFKDTPCAQF